MKQCTKCLQWKEASTDFFYKYKKSKDGLTPACKECRKSYQLKHYHDNRDRYLEYKEEWSEKNREEINRINREWYQNNKEKSKEIYKEWVKNNKDRVRGYQYKYMHKDHNISDKEWLDCKLYFNYECAYCGLSEDESKQEYKKGLHKEHAINDGANDLSNCVPACTGCNSTKHTNDYNTWFTESNPIYDKNKIDKIKQWLSNDYKLYIRKELL